SEQIIKLEDPVTIKKNSYNQWRRDFVSLFKPNNAFTLQSVKKWIIFQFLAFLIVIISGIVPIILPLTVLAWLVFVMYTSVVILIQLTKTLIK
ncbi:hypothetical protein, partial [Leuconostoc falkenbergense]|uniref:hypothetical protein n=1 Tax=Leuconostoc falkenbergense TaxID=2766470 RepID=UPI0028A78B93